MEYKELVEHHTQQIKDQNQNKWKVIETSDLDEICEAYHQDKLKLLANMPKDNFLNTIKLWD